MLAKPYGSIYVGGKTVCVSAQGACVYVHKLMGKVWKEPHIKLQCLQSAKLVRQRGRDIYNIYIISFFTLTMSNYCMHFPISEKLPLCFEKYQKFSEKVRNPHSLPAPPQLSWEGWAEGVQPGLCSFPALPKQGIPALSLGVEGLERRLVLRVVHSPTWKDSL